MLSRVNSMTPELLAWLKVLIANGDLRPFYRTRTWKRIRNEVLEADRHECQRCKAKGFYSSANTVHHVQYIDKHPELGLSPTYVYNGQEHRNLISLCHQCHDEIHEHKAKTKTKPITPERW